MLIHAGVEYDEIPQLPSQSDVFAYCHIRFASTILGQAEDSSH